MSNLKEWVVNDLPWVWQAHVGSSEGILFAFWDISRLLWLVHPEQLKDPSDLLLRDFLLNFKGEKWVYPAIDGAGPNGKMPRLLDEALSHFDRVLNYTEFSAKITGYPDVCTHGIDTNVFFPRIWAKATVNSKYLGASLEPDEVIIGIVATNQPRKDWALAFGALALLNKQGVKARVWIHTDTDLRHWDLKSLYVDFGVQPNVKVFLTPYGISDEDMAVLYSACDVTLGIGPEGAGYPILESMACGVPCIVGGYGGQSDYVPRKWQVDPIAFRHEGMFAVQRPVYNSQDFAVSIQRLLRNHQDAKPAWEWTAEWPKWETWIRKGL
jgi:glycosyltransferase involved in cell wall biosynthesis